MAMIIKESFDTNSFDVTWTNNSKQKKNNIKESLVDDLKAINPNSIMVDIEGIHEYPYATRNFTRYHNLKDSLYTWTKPYLRPLIMHHNEQDGKIIGRIYDAKYKTKDTLSKTPAILFTVNVSDKDGIQQVKDKRLFTTSIGAIAYDCRCSICGHNIAQDGECEHERGAVYDNEVCYWDFYDIEGKELSYVIVPSDKFAQNIKIYSPINNSNIQESLNKKGDFKMEKVKETSVVDETIKDDENDEIELLKAKVIKLEKNFEDEKKKNELLEKDLEETKKILDTAKSNVKKIQDSLTIKEAALIEETKARNVLEQTILDKEKEIKESLVNNILTIRESLNKPSIEKKDLEQRTSNSLKDAIMDLKEEMAIKTNTKIVTNPAIVEEKNNLNVKEETTPSNINLKESVYNLFDNMLKGDR